jgi:hypothetical protein
MDEETQAQLVRALKAQYVQMLQCDMRPVDASFYFTNKFYGHAKSYASTAVVVRAKRGVVHTSVHIKRDARGDPMPALIVDGPSYACSCETGTYLEELTRHASVVLFRVYTKLLYGAQSPVKVVMDQSLPTLPALPPGVVMQPYSESEAVEHVLPQLTTCGRLCTPPPPSGADNDVEAVEARQADEGQRKRRRVSPGTSPCYICWRHRPCDILFPCRRANHACCRRCIVELFQMWSSTEYEGMATMKCPQCACASGPVTTVQGQVVLMGTRYSLRKQRRKSYVESDLD